MPPLTVFLLDGVCGPQPIFPSPFKRARHQAVLGFDGVVLTPGALGFIAGPLSSQGPLLLELPRLIESSDPRLRWRS